ncbi:MAG: type III pantothenate kinase [Siphonobacter sp.]
MSLAIDLGNTFAKAGVFDQEGRLLETYWKLSLQELLTCIDQIQPHRGIIASTGLSEAELIQLLSEKIPQLLVLTPQTPLPIFKEYDTPHTLGSDRVAAAVGARSLFPKQNCVVIDMGTCITYDYVDQNDLFQGGAISPGLRMRFKAMHSFTQRLPLVEMPERFPSLVGKNTIHAMQSGVLNGLVAEVEGMIQQYRQIYPDFQVVLCGGDATIFETRLKEPIFAAPELVLVGLYRILKYNV